MEKITNNEEDKNNNIKTFDQQYHEAHENRKNWSLNLEDKDRQDYKNIKRGHYDNPQSDRKTLYDSYFTLGNVGSVYDLMYQNKILPDYDQDIVFISPSANIPTQEAYICQKDKMFRSGKSQFYVGDWVMDTLRERNKSFFEDLGKIENFSISNWDAEHIPLEKASADIIWEIKGRTRHVANEKNRPGADKKLLNTLAQYSSLLKLNGCIVLDNIPVIDTDFEGYTPSTCLKIDEMDQLYGNIRSQIIERFEIIDLGEGKSAVKVLRKK